jgi:regulator of cell morphogenesis and NO signaling
MPKGLDAERILEEIRRELAGREDRAERWDEAPLAQLIDHILIDYHRPLDEELPRLERMARKVVDVHRDKEPERLPAVLATYLDLKAELDQHMLKEEQILFPMLLRGQGASASRPIQVMEHEHDVAGSLLRRLRELTDGYRVPDGACNTWRALWHGLAALEDSLHRHIHLENNVLFPRAQAR